MYPFTSAAIAAAGSLSSLGLLNKPAGNSTASANELNGVSTGGAATADGKTTDASIDIGSELAALLGIPRGERAANGAPPRLAASAAERRVASATLQLDGQENEVLRWLGTAQTLTQLQPLGVKVGDVRARVGLMTDALRKQLAAWIQSPQGAFPELPTAAMLYQQAVDAARAVQMAGRSDPQRRQHALDLLKAFKTDAFKRCPQLRQGTSDVLTKFAAGEIEFDTIEDAALVFPSASSFRHDGKGRPHVIYPAGNIGGTPLRSAWVKNQEVIVARGEGDSEVKVSTNGIDWQVSAAYRDPVVDKARLELLAELRGQARGLSARRQPGLWNHW